MQMTKALGAYFLMPLPTRVHDLGVGGDEIVAAHARLTRDAGGDDDDIGALDRLVIAGAGIFAVEAFNRRCFRDIQRLALRHTIDDVEQDDVAEVLRDQPAAPTCRRSDLRQLGLSSSVPFCNPDVSYALPRFCLGNAPALLAHSSRC